MTAGAKRSADLAELDYGVEAWRRAAAIGFASMEAGFRVWRSAHDAALIAFRSEQDAVLNQMRAQLEDASNGVIPAVWRALLPNDAPRRPRKTPAQPAE
ncbi:MAG: hypothetical protein AB7L26_05445 [Hyphomonadaceae bacterium]